MSEVTEVVEQEAQEQETQEVAETKQAPKPVQSKQTVPNGYVPASEISKERKLRKEAEAARDEYSAKLIGIEQRETKRGILKEELKTLGDSWTVDNQAELEDLTDALQYSDNVKDIISKLVTTAKRPKGTPGAMPLFGTANRQGNEVNKEQEKYPEFAAMQKRLKQGN